MDCKGWRIAMRMFSGAIVGALVLISTVVSVQADPLRWKAEGWQTDFSKTTIDLDRVLSGGPPRDGIPSIDNPKFVPVSQMSTLEDMEAVISLTVGDVSRAYPVRILTWHEIANDVVAGVPVAVTYCPLCNSSLVFDRRFKGETLEFGTTGKLKDSNLIMYDRTYDTWWQQFSGEAIAGDHAGAELTMLPSRLESWAQFKAAHPDGEVLVPSNPNMRDYGRNPYAGYDLSSRPFLYDGQLPENIDPMERVVVVRRQADDPIVYTVNAIREKNGVSNNGFEIAWTAGQSSALETQSVARGRDVGTISVQKDGKDMPHDVTFAFVAHAFYPDVPIMQE
jgi:hypothetical protein